MAQISVVSHPSMQTLGQYTEGISKESAIRTFEQLKTRSSTCSGSAHERDEENHHLTSSPSSNLQSLCLWLIQAWCTSLVPQEASSAQLESSFQRRRSAWVTYEWRLQRDVSASADHCICHKILWWFRSKLDVFGQFHLISLDCIHFFYFGLHAQTRG